MIESESRTLASCADVRIDATRCCASAVRRIHTLRSEGEHERHGAVAEADAKVKTHAYACARANLNGTRLSTGMRGTRDVRGVPKVLHPVSRCHLCFLLHSSLIAYFRPGLCTMTSCSMRVSHTLKLDFARRPRLSWCQHAAYPRTGDRRQDG